MVWWRKYFLWSLEDAINQHNRKVSGHELLEIEQLAYSGTGAWWLAGLNNSVAESIAHFATEEQKEK